jgi:hypothetical protein
MKELLIQQTVFDLMSQKQYYAILEGRKQNQRMRLLIEKVCLKTLRENRRKHVLKLSLVDKLDVEHIEQHYYCYFRLQRF